MSLRSHNTNAQKPEAGYNEVRNTTGTACAFSASRTADVSCGDLRMARWGKSLAGGVVASCHEGTLGELAGRGYITTADSGKECCFAAVHDRIAQSLRAKGSSWC